MRKIGRLLPAFLTLLVPAAVSAQTLAITPELVDASHAIEDALQTHKGHASTAIEGRGSTLRIGYRSSEAVEMYLVPLAADEMYVPTDFIHLTLPKEEQGDVTIDLTVSPGWSLRNQKWLLNLLSTDETAGLGFTSVEFEDATMMRAVTAAVRHLFTEETYTPSSYHALRGYRFLGMSFTVTLGLLTVITLGVCLVAFDKKSRRQAMLLTLLTGSLLYQVRFSVDLLRLSAEHLHEYYAARTYDEAGSIHEVATYINAQNPDAAVYVCRDGTNFKEKLLRYFIYPVKVSSDEASLKNEAMIVVMNTFKSGFSTSASADGSTGRLQCGSFSGNVQRLRTFTDDTIVFRILPS